MRFCFHFTYPQLSSLFLSTQVAISLCLRVSFRLHCIRQCRSDIVFHFRLLYLVCCTVISFLFLTLRKHIEKCVLYVRLCMCVCVKSFVFKLITNMSLTSQTFALSLAFTALNMNTACILPYCYYEILASTSINMYHLSDFGLKAYIHLLI